MKKNNFIWADLSAFDLESAKSFYQNVFGWQYADVGNNYQVAFAQYQETSGLYLMPQKFIDINMPSFWMSYIQVEDVLATVDKAQSLGGIIELLDTEMSIGNIALIRDPSGAGFTVYDGSQLKGRTEDTPGTMVWNELFVSDSGLVTDFYAGIFDWHYEQDTHDRVWITTSEGVHIAAIQQVSNDIKGKHEYWAVYFGTKNLSETTRKVIGNGGKVIYETSEEALFTDPHGAMFQAAQL